MNATGFLTTEPRHHLKSQNAVMYQRPAEVVVVVVGALAEILPFFSSSLHSSQNHFAIQPMVLAKNISKCRNRILNGKYSPFFVGALANPTQSK